MRYSTRLGLLGAAAALALAFAGSALASFAPKLYVGNGAAGVTIKVSVGAADDPTAAVIIYAPPGYALKDPPPAGTKLGDVTASAQAADLGGAILPLTGTLLAADPASLPQNACPAAPGTHAQVWLLNLTAAGQQLQIPMYVDPTVGTPAAAFSSFKIVTCLPPPDVPAGTPGRATFGAKLLSAEFGTSAVIPAAGASAWHSLWTPYVPQKGTANGGGTVEAQALVRPVAVTIAARRAGKRSVALAAKVAPAVAGTTVSFLAGGKRVASAKTSASGVATVVVALRKATSFTASASLADADLGAAGCTTPVPTGGSPFPCVDATVRGGKATSKAVRVRA